MIMHRIVQRSKAFQDFGPLSWAKWAHSLTSLTQQPEECNRETPPHTTVVIVKVFPLSGGIDGQKTVHKECNP